MVVNGKSSRGDIKMIYSLSNFIFAFAITLFSGLSTGIGSLILYKKQTFNQHFLAMSLGFSAGVMIYLSFIELLPESRKVLEQSFGHSLGLFYTTVAFFVGIGLVACINRLIPEADYFKVKLANDETTSELNHKDHQELYRIRILTMITLAIHNFPEGFASFFGGLHNTAWGLNLGFAIAIHNIPEGIAVAIPIYYATKNKKQAIKISFLSGLTEPLGAIIGFLFLLPFYNEMTFAILFAVIAGIMTYISLDELIPIAEKYGEHHLVMKGFLLGMAVISVSLML